MSQEINNAKATKTKEVATKTKKVATKKNVEKVDAPKLTIKEVMKMYEDYGISVANPEAKGLYRIMGPSVKKGGSSLNIQKDQYVIYTTNEDYKTIVGAGIKADDLVLEEGTNTVDKKRPNAVKFKTVETLKKLLAAYSVNPLYKIVKKEEVVAK